jgi:hypothetical protein
MGTYIITQKLFFIKIKTKSINEAEKVVHSFFFFFFFFFFLLICYFRQILEIDLKVIYSIKRKIECIFKYMNLSFNSNHLI